jgi:hypothetical protein
MANSAGTIESWQKYDITVTRNIWGVGNNWSGNGSYNPPVAVYRFDAGTGVFLSDILGNNGDFYSPNLAISPQEDIPPVQDQSNYKQGDASLYAVTEHSIDTPQPNYQFVELVVDDSNLASNFPGKNGTSNTGMSVCFWFKADWDPIKDEYMSSFGWIGKENVEPLLYGSDCSWKIELNHPYNTLRSYEYYKLNLRLYESQILYEEVETSITFRRGIWYHITVTHTPYESTSVPGTYRIRVWDDGAQGQLFSDYTDFTTYDMTPSAAPLHMNNTLNNANPQAGDIFMTRWDELVIFNRAISVTEIDAVRAGTWPPST